MERDNGHDPWRRSPTKPGNDMNAPTHPGILLIFLFIASAMPMAAEERNYPLPQAFSQSVIVGKRLKNPFAAQLRATQAKVNHIVKDNSSNLKEMLEKRLTIGTTMYFGAESERNRAIIDGKVRRPGDKVITLSHRERGPVSFRLVEIRPSSVVLQDADQVHHKDIILSSKRTGFSTQRTT